MVYGEVDQKMVETLSRSVGGKTLIPFEVQSVEHKIKQKLKSVISVKDMGAYKVLIT